jgi:hypothetical protein
MILFVSPNTRIENCIAAVADATEEQVIAAKSLSEATSLARAEVCSVVVLDQYLFEIEPDETETLLLHLGTAIPVQVNLAISGTERVVREVRAALRRRKQEEDAARAGAVRKLHADLNETVTALLLSCDLAAETPGLAPAAAERLRSIRDLVRKLRSQLYVETADEATFAAN